MRKIIHKVDVSVVQLINIIIDIVLSMVIETRMI
jgi:hypothetical protein